MAETIGLARLRELLEEGVALVEVLPAEEYEEEHLPGAVSIPLKTMDAKTVAGLDRSSPVVVYCWDELCDMSPRAACRLDTLGFETVYDYLPGKAEWLAHALPTEGPGPDEPRIVDHVHDDVVTCGLSDRVGDIASRVEESPYRFALVVSEGGVVLGRLRGSAFEGDDGLSAEEAMEPGPSTMRPDISVEEAVKRLRERELRFGVVTRADGTLMGIFRRTDADAG